MTPLEVAKFLERSGMLIADATRFVDTIYSKWHCPEVPTVEEWKRLFKEFSNNHAVNARIENLTDQVPEYPWIPGGEV